MFPSHYLTSLWLTVPDAWLLNLPHPRLRRLFPESIRGAREPGRRRAGVPPAQVLVWPPRAELPGPLADLPHSTGTGGQMAQGREALGVAHSLGVWPGLPHPSLSCTGKLGMGAGWTRMPRRGLQEPDRAQFPVCDTHESTGAGSPRDYSSFLSPGPPRALGLASLTPQQRDRAWTLAHRPRTPGS